MASIILQNLDPATTAALQTRARRHGRSVEDEAVQILKTTLEASSSGAELLALARAAFSGVGGVEDLELPSRQSGVRAPPDFGDGA